MIAVGLIMSYIPLLQVSGFMAHRGKDNITTPQNKRWYSIYESYIFCHKYIFVKLAEFLGNHQNVPCHVDWFILSGISF